MKKILLVLSLSLSFLVPCVHAKVKGRSPAVLAPTTPTALKTDLLSRYMKNTKDKNEILKLKADTLALGGKAVPALIEVMKNDKYPEKSRWMSTFMLGQIMGEKSAPYIARYTEHPSWVMRMASLKTLLALQQKKYGKVYAKRLSDKSYIVRVQALDNIRTLELTEYAPYVWAMLYDKTNYHAVSQQKGKNKVHKRTHIVKSVVKTVGDLKFQDAKKPLFSMIQKKRYADIFEEMDYALEKITGKKSPKGNKKVKQVFWKRLAMSETVI